MTLVKLTNSQRPVYRGYTDVLDSLFNPEQFIVKGIPAKVPAANISETDAEFRIELSAPGFKKEDFKINLEQNVLTVSSGTKISDTEQTESAKYRRQEFRISSFKRSFRIPESADLNEINAAYNEGILILKIAKKEEAKIQSREIAVK